MRPARFAPKFKLGRVAVSPRARLLLDREDIAAAVNRHAQGDWGLVSEEGRRLNDKALRWGPEIVSKHLAPNGTVFCIRTKHLRTFTAVLLPDEL